MRKPKENPYLEPDIRNLSGTIDKKILDAMVVASRQLKNLGIRHALIGGLALGAYGYIRATKDVDFLVGDEGFQHFNFGLVASVAGVPSTVNGIRVDTLSTLPDEGYLEKSLDGTVESEGIPVASVEVLVYLKLKSPRPKDFTDVVSLLEAGVNPGPVEAYLRAHSPDLLPKFQRAVTTAQE